MIWEEAKVYIIWDLCITGKFGLISAAGVLYGLCRRNSDHIVNQHFYQQGFFNRRVKNLQSSIRNLQSFPYLCRPEKIGLKINRHGKSLSGYR